uniref:F-box/LRR-repeat protein At3g58900-like n=1 Tax=Nicotiana tabacum TaxID=4097 RepID=A0A1S4DRD9_TOBAC|nr:PREDICTED: F-box/LRR-repeat protein At3g58900-like [Nicotiana tabacum]
MDQISQLPDPILQHILFFLPAKDAAQTSVLSRTWLNVWNLLPILTFDFDENAFIQKHLSAEIEEQKQADEGDAFLNHIDSPLTNLRIQKAIIQKFRLSLNFSDTKNASCIDEWIGLATNNCINELDIHIMRQDDKLDWYSLPGTVITAKSLVVLGDVHLIEEVLAVEDLSLVECRGVKDILISNLPNLLKLTLHQEDDIANENILIQAVNLQMEELNEITSFCSPSVVKHLMLKDVAPPLNFESLLDGLFWTCHPESLSVESMWGRSDEFMQFLREKLMEKEGVQPVCCDSRSVKCWRHYLKGIEVENSTTSLHGDSFSPCQDISIASIAKVQWVQW